MLTVAVVGKFAGAMLLRMPFSRRLIIGTAMIPRGEVGLIFAELGRTSGIFSNEIYAGTIMVITTTTLAAPFALKYLYKRSHGDDEGETVKGLIARLMNDARIPVIKHLHGVCHVYVGDKADLDKALRIADTAKTSRYGTCNTMETLLVHRTVSDQFLPRIAAIYAAKGVEMRGCAESRRIVPAMQEASEADWHEEYLAPIIAIRVVDDISAAIAHIAQYGSQHTDAIVTEDYSRARRFLREVDSSSVMVNASTRFADGFEYGLGR